jgi:hypothetical protein
LSGLVFISFAVARHVHSSHLWSVFMSWIEL